MSRLPRLYSDLARWGVIQADTLELLTKLPESSVDAVITDPPYGISFNGMAWDGKQMRDVAASAHPKASGPEAFEYFSHLWGVEAFRVLKPGGHLVSFGAARTFHRLTSAIEDTGSRSATC
ncbi:MAG: hypothetical protein M9938_09955 [Solirubrobacterales bacterium]|nr:hypothetical protein [Solirubrobacterales bacterium]